MPVTPKGRILHVRSVLLLSSLNTTHTLNTTMTPRSTPIARFFVRLPFSTTNSIGDTRSRPFWSSVSFQVRPRRHRGPKHVRAMHSCQPIAVLFLSVSILFVGTVTSTRTVRADSSLLTLDFDSMPAGKPPSGFTAARTGRGAPGRWVVREDETAPSGTMVLAQTSSDPTSKRFPVCVYDGFSAADVELSVRFRPLSGEVDQAAGLVWRYQDADAYYVVRANALEDNVVLYKVEDGKRSDLRPTDASLFAYGKDAPVPTGSWSTLRVVVRGQKFSVWLNDEHLFDVEDDTFQGPGRVGLWTKADSVTVFDSFAIQKR